MSKSIEIREEVLKSLVRSLEVTNRSVIERCAEHYNFDPEDALRMLGMVSVSVSVTTKKEKKEKKEKTEKSSFPLPYNGERSELCCQALRQNNGLYTQCLLSRKGESEYCKSCQSSADKSESGSPEYGTIQQRLAADILNYVDPKGRKPVAFAKVMKKYKLTEEQVLTEAEKFNININPIHFQKETEKIKRGRPASQKEAKEAKGAKGRPKKSKKVIQIEGESDDLFASLVASAQSEATGSEAEVEAEAETEVEAEAETEVEEPVKKQKAPKKSDEEKAALKEALALAKQEKEAKALEEKQAKASAKAAKALEEKEAKAAKALEEKESKASAKAAKALEEKEAKAAKAKPEKKILVGGGGPGGGGSKVEEEPDVVKKIEIDGKKYLKSKKSGIIYDYIQYTKNGEQVVVGQWNESKNKIDFSAAADEESEEEYDEESEEEL